MKRIARFLTVALCALLAVGAGALAACGSEKTEPRKTCLVQVDGGTGGGYYYVDTNCTVVAEVPEGKQFMKWTSGSTDLSPNAEYTFTVTKNIRLKAVFADDIPDMNVYTVSVRYGYGGGIFFKGTSVHLKAGEYYGATFTGWEAAYKGANGEAVTETVSTEPEFDLTVDKDISLVARYDAEKLQTPNNDNGEMFRISANGAYEMDRNGSTAFVNGCAYLLYTAYERDENGDFVAVGRGKMVPLAEKEGEYYHYMWSMDETLKVGLKGNKCDIYQDVASAKDVIRAILNVQTNKKYYISVQAKGGDDTPIDSEESAKFAVQF